MNSSKLLCLFFILLSFFSCASKKKVVMLTNEDEPKELELDEKEAQQLKNSKGSSDSQDANHIVGAPQIFSPSQYDKKTYLLHGADELNLENLYFDIPVVYNKQVKKWIRYFTKKGRKHFIRYSERAGRYGPVLSQILHGQGMPGDLIFLSMAESGFQNKAKSWAKAVGAWQFMPFTGKKFGLKIDWFVDERRDPIKATIAASKYLKLLYDMFGSWELAMAAYNAGEGKIGRAIRRYKTRNFWKLRRYRYIKRETKDYVPKIMALAIIGKNLKSFGFEELDFQDPLDFEEVEVSGNQDLYEIANALGVSFKELKRYNPELRRWQTPFENSDYILRLPVGYKAKWDSCCQGKTFTAKNYKPYSIRGRRASLKAVAKKFKLKTKLLAQINGVSVRDSFKRGEKVLLPFHKTHSRKNSMYADLYDKPRRSVLRKRRYRKMIKRGKRRGRVIASPSTFHVVKRGESLWTIAKKYGQSINTIIATNSKLLGRRQIRAGDRIAIR